MAKKKNSKSMLAIDFGASTLKVGVFETKPDGTLVLTGYVIHQLGAGAMDEVFRKDILRDALKTVIDQLEIRSKVIDANVCMPSFQSFSKFFSVPAVEAGQVSKMVLFEAKQNVPFALDEVSWDYHVVGTNSAEGLEIMLLAIKADLIEALSQVCRDNHVRLNIVDASPSALRNAFMHNYGSLEGCSMVLDIGAKTSNVLFVENQMFYTRSIPIGAMQITQEFAKESQLDLEQAETFKNSYGSVHLGGAYEEHADPYQAMVSKVARNVLTRLHQQVQQTITFYRSQKNGTAPMRLFLSGGGSTLAYTAEFFHEKLNGLPVEYLNPFLNIEKGPEVKEEELMAVAHSMGEVAGLGLRDVVLGMAEFNLLPKSEQLSRKIDRRGPYVVATIYVAGLMLLLFAGYDWRVASMRKESTELQIAKIDPLRKANEEMKRAMAKLSTVELEAAKLERLLQSRYVWVELIEGMKKSLSIVEPEVFITDTNILLRTAPMDKIDKTTITVEQSAVWIMSFGVQPPADSGDTKGGPMGGMGGGPGGPGGPGGMKGGGAAKAADKAAPIDTLYIKLRAKNLNRVRELANRDFAALVQTVMKTNSLFVADGTKLVGDIQSVIADELTFNFEMQLKLKAPIMQQDLQGALPGSKYKPAGSGGGMEGAMGGMGGMGGPIK